MCRRNIYLELLSNRKFLIKFIGIHLFCKFSFFFEIFRSFKVLEERDYSRKSSQIFAKTLIRSPLGIENIYFTLICWNVSPPRWAIFIRYQFAKLIRWVWELSMFKNRFLRQIVGYIPFLQIMCCNQIFMWNSQLAIWYSNHTITKFFIFKIFNLFQCRGIGLINRWYLVITCKEISTQSFIYSWGNSTCTDIQNINRLFSGEEGINPSLCDPGRREKINLKLVSAIFLKLIIHLI